MVLDHPAAHGVAEYEIAQVVVEFAGLRSIAERICSRSSAVNATICEPRVRVTVSLFASGVGNRHRLLARRSVIGRPLRRGAAQRVVERVDDRLSAGHERVKLGFLFGPRADPDRMPGVEPVERPRVKPDPTRPSSSSWAAERPATFPDRIPLLFPLLDELALRSGPEPP